MTPWEYDTSQQELNESLQELNEYMADLIERQDRLLKLADDMANSPTAEDEDALAAVVAYRAARNEELEVKLAKAVEALSGVMVGGNHLALLLPDNFPPAETKPLDALEIMGAGRNYEVWCCWRSIMLARTTLAELTGGKDE